MIEKLQKTNELTIKTNNEEYLIDFENWTIEIGELIAKKHNIELTETHWDILSWIQEQFKADKDLTIEGILGTGITDLKGLKTLFTDDALAVSAKIAGILKPKNCA